MTRLENLELRVSQLEKAVAQLTTRPTAGTCCLCGQPAPITDRWGEGPDSWGHNPEPLASEGRCCSDCNSTRVIPARLGRMVRRKKKE